MATRLNKQSLEANWRRSRYDWGAWLDGGVWQGRKGEDFTCKTTSFVSQLYKAAYDRGLRIHVRLHDNDVVEWEAFSDENASDVA